MTRRHQPRNSASLLNEPVRQSGDPEVAVVVEFGAEGVLVVVAGDPPAVADGLKHVGSAVAVFILDARDFARAGRSTASRRARPEPEHFVQAAGEEREVCVFRILGQRLIDQIDFAAPRGDGQLAVGQEFQCTRLPAQSAPASESESCGNSRPRPFVAIAAGHRSATANANQACQCQQKSLPSISHQSYVSSIFAFAIINATGTISSQLAVVLPHHALAVSSDSSDPPVIDLVRAVRQRFDLVGRDRAEPDVRGRLLGR